MGQTVIQRFEHYFAQRMVKNRNAAIHACPLLITKYEYLLHFKDILDCSTCYCIRLSLFEPVHELLLLLAYVRLLAYVINEFSGVPVHLQSSIRVFAARKPKEGIEKKSSTKNLGL